MLLLFSLINCIINIQGKAGKDATNLFIQYTYTYMHDLKLINLLHFQV